jgi:DNA polymerase-3 subunit delta
VVALKSGEIETFLTRPDPRLAIVLVFGPDLGLVRERADSLAKAATGGKADDAFSVVASRAM